MIYVGNTKPMEVKYTDTKPIEPTRRKTFIVMLGKCCVSECDDDANCKTLLSLLGDCASGKSCLARRFIEGPSVLHDRTFGQNVDLFGMRIECGIALVNDYVRLSISLR